MEIPIITLKGKSFTSRVSASILNQVNLNELITNKKDDYQNFAINLAKDKKKLKKIKDDLKISLSKSKLFDSVKFTNDLENIFLKLLNEKINLAITGCMGRMGQQLIKSSKLDKNFNLVTVTENKIINKKIFGIKPSLNTENAFKKANVIIDFTIRNVHLKFLKLHQN